MPKDKIYDGRDGSEVEYELNAEGVLLTGVTGKTPMFLSDPAELPLRPEHTHSWYEWFYVSSGRMFCRVEEETFFLGAGEMLLVPPGVLHYTRAEENLERYVFNFSCRFLRETPTAKGIARLLNRGGRLHFRAGQEERRSAVLLYEALKGGKTVLAATYLFELLLCASQREDLGAPSVEGLLSDSSIGRLYKLEHIFHSYYMSDISLSELAAELHISVRQLSRIIAKQYGMSYRQKITAMRMEAALHLLEGGMSVCKTAEKVGYASFSCFDAAFLKTYGVLPSAIQRKKGGRPAERKGQEEG